MSHHWGVDSFNAVDHEVRVPDRLREAGDPERQSLFDYVVRRAGRVPEFWGRYLGRSAMQLQPGESRFIAERGQYWLERLQSEGPRQEAVQARLRRPGWSARCRILLVYNRITRIECQQRGRAGFRHGEQSAHEACRIARTLGAPTTTRIYADLENWSASADWIRGWWETMQGHEYSGMGGLYGNSGWHSTTPGGLPQTVVRTWGRRAATMEHEMRDRAIEADLARDEHSSQNRSHNFSRYVWSNRPWQRGDPPEGQLAPTQFRPVSPGSGMTTVVWQYRCACFGTQESGGHGLIDMNLATDLGFGEMWIPNR